ncbi:hypothetical protein SLEP1_g7384 [Rubroshorea leprosula]|uniref:Uncharacterized protein n=1 Tax=Rubroshorea leprosula TaxID=152421 RepID=A0AAV5I2T7_9ROSI|nr:hypothetical protein SLEP1_g7384 [Rubroshorea leprosula]
MIVKGLTEKFKENGYTIHWFSNTFLQHIHGHGHSIPCITRLSFAR